MQHDKVTTRVIQQGDWEGFQLQKLAIHGDGHHPVPAMLLLPDGEGAPHPCVIAVHGFTDKKEAWIKLDGYTKGRTNDSSLSIAGTAFPWITSTWSSTGSHPICESVLEGRHEHASDQNPPTW